MQNLKKLQLHHDRQKKRRLYHDRHHKKEQHDESEHEKPRFFSFPEELIEKIFASMPFPSVFKARCLSKSWNRKFCFPGGESPRKSLTPFQKEASSVSHKWPVYSPVFVSRAGFRGFDRLSSQWKSMFTDCKWSTITSPALQSYGNAPNCVGSLLIWSSLREIKSGLQSLTITIVINVITGSWTSLHFEQVKKHEIVVLASLLPGESNTSFRVLRICRVWDENSSCHELQTSLYDSKVDGWSVSLSKGLNFPFVQNYPIGFSYFDKFYSNNVYLHGKLYCLWGLDFFQTGTLFCTYHVDSDKTWTVSRLSFTDSVNFGGLLPCGEKIIVAICHAMCNIFIYELDLEELGSKQLLTRNRILPDTNCTHGIRFASDDDFIYVNDYLSAKPVMTYNVHSGEWGTLPHDCHKKRNVTMLHSPFRPGLDPFAIGGAN